MAGSAAPDMAIVSDLRPILPPGWRWRALGDSDVCEINPPRAAGIVRGDDEPTSFIPMSAVDERSGTLSAVLVRPYGEIKRGYTFVREGDVLFAKITPCMQNGKHAIARELTDGVGFASTEFHVARPRPGIHADWVRLYLTQPSVLESAVRSFTGSAGQRRVPADFLRTLEVPVPPMTEQLRVLGILGEQMGAVERARAAAEAQLEAARALAAAHLRSVFDCAAAQRWPRRRVSALCKSIDYGYTASADHEALGPRYLRITDIQDGKIEWASVPGCHISAEDEKSKALADGDIVFARTGATTGKSILIKRPPRAVFASYLIRLRPTDDVSPEYLYAFFQSDGYWRQVRALARGGAQPNVNATLLGSIQVPVCPRSEQARVCTELASNEGIVGAVRRAAERQLFAVEALPAALLRRAFSGEL